MQDDPTSNSASSGDGNPVWRLGKHIPQLDGVRGLAILIVTLYRFSRELPNEGWFNQLLHRGFAFGTCGVELFFVLSGLLITGILLDARGQPHYFRNFLARRSLRIFPLYFFALFLFVIAAGWVPAFRGMFVQATENQFYLWTYLVNVKMSLEAAWCFGYLDHFWSLAVEEHFYLVWPLVIFLLTPKTALRVALALIIVSLFSRVGFAAVSENGVATEVLTIFRVDALLLGAVLAFLLRTPKGIQPLLSATYIVFPVCLVICLASGLFGKSMLTVPLTMWPLMWTCMLIWLLAARRDQFLGRVFDLSILRKLGKYSYGMYVFQSPLIPITSGVISASGLATALGNEMIGSLVYMATMCALTFGAALLSWYLLERHCLELKKWFALRTLDFES